jgi:hypothetical protein
MDPQANEIKNKVICEINSFAIVISETHIANKINPIIKPNLKILCL